MGEWKVQISFKVRQALRAELGEFAAREKRKLGNLGELVLEWAFEQPMTAGSTQNLLKYRIRRHGQRTPTDDAGLAASSLQRLGRNAMPPNDQLKFQVNCDAGHHRQLRVASELLVVSVGQTIVHDGPTEIWDSVVIRCSEEPDGSCMVSEYCRNKGETR